MIISTTGAYLYDHDKKSMAIFHKGYERQVSVIQKGFAKWTAQK
jgi:hypothetical protein